MDTTGSMQESNLDKVLHLLAAKDDTSRFVALSLIPSLMTTDNDARPDVAVVQKLWATLPKSFLLRLLRTRLSRSIPQETAMHMNHLAISIIHAFVSVESVETLEIYDFTESLIRALPCIERPQQVYTYQILEHIAVSSAPALLRAQEPLVSTYVTFAGDEWHAEHFVRLCRLTRIHATLTPADSDVWLAVVGRICSQSKEPVLFVNLLSDVALSRKVSKQEFQYWIDKFIPKMKQWYQSPKNQLHSCVVRLFATLLHTLPPDMEFVDHLYCLSGRHNSLSDQSFTYQFLLLLLADIRSSIPSLMTRLIEPSYAATSMRLAMSFDLVTAFLHELTIFLDLLENDTAQTLPLKAESILNLRENLSEAYSLTIEYFRDRWDASVAGAPGLHESVRISTSTSGSLLQLPWDNSDLPTVKDPFILAGLRSLSVWLQDDDQEQILVETTRIMDMLVALVKIDLDSNTRNLTCPILSIFATLFSSSTEAIETFLDHDGWEIMKQHTDFTKSTDEIRQILEVLFLVIDSDAVHQSRLDWLEIIPRFSMARKAILSKEDIAVSCRLCQRLYEKAPSNSQVKFQSEMSIISTSKRLV